MNNQETRKQQFGTGGERTKALQLGDLMKQLSERYHHHFPQGDQLFLRRLRNYIDARRFDDFQDAVEREVETWPDDLRNIAVQINELVNRRRIFDRQKEWRTIGPKIARFRDQLAPILENPRIRQLALERRINVDLTDVGNQLYDPNPQLLDVLTTRFEDILRLLEEVQNENPQVNNLIENARMIRDVLVKEQDSRQTESRQVTTESPELQIKRESTSNMIKILYERSNTPPNNSLIALVEQDMDERDLDQIRNKITESSADIDADEQLATLVQELGNYPPGREVSRMEGDRIYRLRKTRYEIRQKFSGSILERKGNPVDLRDNTNSEFGSSEKTRNIAA